MTLVNHGNSKSGTSAEVDVSRYGLQLERVREGDAINVRNATDVVWLGVELYCKKLDDDLRKWLSRLKHSARFFER